MVKGRSGDKGRVFSTQGNKLDGREKGQGSRGREWEKKTEMDRGQGVTLGKSRGKGPIEKEIEVERKGQIAQSFPKEEEGRWKWSGRC